MFRALIMICNVTSFDTCDPGTARAVMRPPLTFNSQVECFVRAQAYFAESAIKLDPDETIKIRCIGGNR